jgi:tripartite-type tricarboxylate transporter receptor subunit TctC
MRENAMKRLIVATVALLLGFTSASAADISRIVVGFPAGQATDIVARLIAERIGPILGETFIVENRPGQGGSIALAQLAKTQPDGRTLVLAPLASLVANPHLYKSVGYDTLKDFAPVTLVCDLPILFVVNPTLPVKNVAELIAYAKANPDKVNYSSSGNGTLSHLGMEDFKRRAGISLMHVPYRGSPPAMTDLVAGVVGAGMDTVTVTQPFVQAGSLRAIASAYSQRIPTLPDVPTLAEQGFPGFGIAAWIGFVAPAATPKERIDALNAAVSKVVQTEEIAEKFATLGVIQHLMGPAEFAEFIASENSRWSAVVKAVGARVD